MYEVNNFLTSLVLFIGVIILAIKLGWELCLKNGNNNKNNDKEEKNGQKSD
jgi:hypothetical protein